MSAAPPDVRSGAASTPHRSRSTLVALGALALWLLATLGLRPLLLPDEGRYAETARAMLQGDLWVPTLDGLPFFHKPPLFYWLDCAAMQVFGSNEFAARLAPAFGAWLMGASLLMALRRWHGAAAARTGLVVLATTPMFFIGGQYANHDMLVAGLITASVLALVRGLDPAPRHGRAWVVAGWALCALAVLAKGLIGLVLPAVVIVPWLVASGRSRAVLKLLHPLGLLAFALLALPWFVAAQLRYPGFFDYFIMEQHFRRYAQSTFNNVHGPWFFIVVMPVLTLPWSLWLGRAARRGWAARHGHPGLYLWWIVAVLGFFSIPSSKLVGYALPALAPWCALLSLALPQPDGGRRWRVIAAVTAGVCVAIVAAVAWKAPGSNRALALTLAQARAPNDVVVMVDEYLYDVPFYARLQRPVLVASDWADPSLPSHDNWRKELFDAARFNPALGRELLVPLTDLDRLGCGAPAVWFITAPQNDAQPARMPGAQRLYGDGHQELWRVDGRACS